MTQRNKEALKEEYLRWLEPQLKDEHATRTKTYWDLANLMFETEFTWSVPMDDNRLVDAMDLRVEFARLFRASPNRLRSLGPPSFLEVLIVLSRKMAFTAGGSAPGWAWQLLNNIELLRMSDPLSRAKYNRAQEIMHVVISRTYAPDGTGGFFPLAWPDDDQTKIELWYQLNAYVEELHPEH